MPATDRKIALLIDGDNAEASLIEQILTEASKHGKITIKRIYADFTSQHMNGWKEQLNVYAIRPIQKFSYTKGKNSTDTALIIDAMDIMHDQLVDGFCIVSSDSDYTGMAHRIREEGLFVMGIGKAHTPEAFVKACENFTYTEILRPKAKKAPKPPKENGETMTADFPKKKLKPKQGNLRSILTEKPVDMDIINSAFEMVYDDMTGLAMGSQLGAALKKVDPSFDIRNYGHTSFRKFIEALRPHFEIEQSDEKHGLMIKRGKADQE